MVEREEGAGVTGMTPEQTIGLAFDNIKTAAFMLEIFPYREYAESLQQQSDAAWYTNPTFHCTPGNTEDIRRKIALFNAAADFVSKWNEIKAEVLEEDSAA